MAIPTSFQELTHALTAALPILASLLAAYFVLLSAYRLTFHPLAKYPGPFFAKILPFQGFVHSVKGDVHLDMYRCHQKYGNIVRYGPNRLLVNTTEGFKDIYSHGKNVRKSDDYHAFPMQRGAHSTHNAIDKIAHGRKKRILSQSLGDSALTQVEPIVAGLVKKFCTLLIGSTKEGEWSDPVNMADLTNYLTFDVMSDLVFGRSYNMLEKPDNRIIVEDIEFASARAGMIFQLGIFGQLYMDKIVFPRMGFRQLRFRRTCEIMANERMANPKLSTRKDVLGNVIAARDPETGLGFPVPEVWAEALLLIIAGSDTSSTSLSGLSFYFSQHPSIQARCAAEVRAHFPAVADIVTGPKLAGCVLLRACLDEAMRLSPPVGGALWRVVQKGGAVVGGVPVAEGTTVGTGTYALHHNGDVFPEPFAFKPERWIVGEENSREDVDRARAGFAAFSIGPRGCVGKSLAYMTMMLAAAHMVHEFEFRFADPREGEKGEYVLRDAFTAIKHGPFVEFKRRG